MSYKTNIKFGNDGDGLVGECPLCSSVCRLKKSAKNNRSYHMFCFICRAQLLIHGDFGISIIDSCIQNQEVYNA